MDIVPAKSFLGTSTPNRNLDSICPMKGECLYGGFGIFSAVSDS